MRAVPTNATLPQLINHYRTASAGIEAGTHDDLILHTYHSMAIDGYSLTLTETQASLQHRIQIPGKTQTHQWAVIDHLDLLHLTGDGLWAHLGINPKVPMKKRPQRRTVCFRRAIQADVPHQRTGRVVPRERFRAGSRP